MVVVETLPDDGRGVDVLSCFENVDRAEPFALQSAKPKSSLVAEGLVSERASSDQLALLEAAAPLIQERIALLSEVVPMLGFFCIRR